MKKRLSYWHHQRFQEDLPFWLELTHAGATVLELGCGGGRVSIPLAKAGREVWGIDHDPVMLQVARDELEVTEGPITGCLHLLAMDMRSFQLSLQFDYIISPCNTYSQFTGDERKSILNRVTQHLPPGGVFSVSLPNPAQVRGIIHDSAGQRGGDGPILEDVFTHPQTGYPVQVSSHLVPKPDGLEWTWIYDQLLPDGTVERERVTQFHPLSTVEGYSGEFAKVGFTVERFGDFRGSPYANDSPYLVLVGERGSASDH